MASILINVRVSKNQYYALKHKADSKHEGNLSEALRELIGEYSLYERIE